jgi:ABC-2 type transport system ATP-binding protein
MEPIISARSLSKQFRRAQKEPGLRGALTHLVKPRFSEFTAVDSVDFTINAGESVAYVGPNGAGKSTTVNLLTGILVPTSGEVMVCGIQPFQHRQENARNIGVVFGQRTQLWAIFTMCPPMISSAPSAISPMCSTWSHS